VTVDENFKCLSFSTFRGSDERRFLVSASDVLPVSIRKLP
jgi:hypothetical protein